MWIRLWVIRLDICENFKWHKSHWYGFSHVWVRLCLVKSLDRANFIGHKSHEKGFSPVCNLWCFVKSFDCVNLFWQISHWYGFSSVCVLLCTNILDLWVKVFGHWLQVCRFCFEEILLCIFSWVEFGNFSLDVLLMNKF